MSWHCLRDAVADYSAADVSGVSLPSAPWKRSRIAEKCSSDASGTVCFPCFQSGTTPGLSTDTLGMGLWISSRPVSHASRSPSPARIAVEPTNGTSGPTLPESLAKYDPASRSWRTSQGSLLTDTSDEYSETWPRSGTLRNGIVYRRPASAPPTVETDSGFLPAPATVDSGSFFNRSASSGAATRPTLGAMARFNLWPTPKSSPSGPDFARMNRPDSGGDDLATAVARKTWLTPSANEDAAGTTKGKMQSDPEGTAAGGQLNPDWVEWLMGWPIGWTALPPLGMDRFQKWLHAHGAHW